MDAVALVRADGAGTVYVPPTDVAAILPLDASTCMVYVGDVADGNSPIAVAGDADATNALVQTATLVDPGVATWSFIAPGFSGLQFLGLQSIRYVRSGPTIEVDGEPVPTSFVGLDTMPSPVTVPAAASDVSEAVMLGLTAWLAATGGGGGAPSGPASGDLDGTYPAPEVVAVTANDGNRYLAAFGTPAVGADEPLFIVALQPTLGDFALFSRSIYRTAPRAVLIAADNVNADQWGIDGYTHLGAGEYTMDLVDPVPSGQVAGVQVTASASGFTADASISGQTITVNTWDAAGVQADAPFVVVVWLAPESA